MDARLSRSSEADRHGWNSYDNYREVHERRLEAHPFVDHDRTEPLKFDFYEINGEIWLVVEGIIYCKHGVVLEVTKWLETRLSGRRYQQIQVRGAFYRYNAHLAGRHTILRYDNSHDPDEYHVHRYDLRTGAIIDRRSLTRNEFPHISEVLDELQSLYEQR